MEEEEEVRALGGVPPVEGAHSLEGIANQRIVLRHHLLRGVAEVRQQGEADPGCGIGQIVGLETLAEDFRAPRPDQHRGHDDEGRELLGDALLELELGEDSRRQEQGEQMIHQPHRQLADRQDRGNEADRQPEPRGSDVALPCSQLASASRDVPRTRATDPK